MRLSKKHDSIILLIGLCISVSIATSATPPSISRIYLLSPASMQDRIPKATESCSPEEAKWWEDVREVGHQYSSAAYLKHKAVNEARRKRGIREDENDGLSQDERESYDAQIIRARENYVALLREGAEKAYRVPIRDRKNPLILYSGRVWYTREARARRVTGEVRLSVEFRAEGAVGEVKVVRGVGYGLDEKAIEAVRQMVFLPAVNSGRLTTVSKTIEVAFNLK
jgi:TonB family protein